MPAYPVPPGLSRAGIVAFNFACPLSSGSSRTLRNSSPVGAGIMNRKIDTQSRRRKRRLKRRICLEMLEPRQLLAADAAAAEDALGDPASQQRDLPGPGPQRDQPTR